MSTPPFNYSMPTWELRLLCQANEALSHQPGEQSTSRSEEAKLEAAFRHCSNLTAKHSRSFYLASAWLPSSKRRAIRALYAFCRVADDIVDLPSGDPAAELAAWRRLALASRPASPDPVALAWADTRHRYNIPLRFTEQLLDGVRKDLQPWRSATFDDLAAYAYGVASTVGLMSMHIIGFSGPEALPYAIKLGVALQLTNILRDVGEDQRAGRIYLPLDELWKFGLAETDIARGLVDDRWRAFMRFQIERNRRLYSESQPGIAMLDADGRLAVLAATAFYQAILDDIEAHDYDVFSRRAHVAGLMKLKMLIGLWRQSHDPAEKPYKYFL